MKTFKVRFWVRGQDCDLLEQILKDTEDVVNYIFYMVPARELRSGSFFNGCFAWATHYAHDCIVTFKNKASFIRFKKRWKCPKVRNDNDTFDYRCRPSDRFYRQSEIETDEYFLDHHVTMTLETYTTGRDLASGDRQVRKTIVSNCTMDRRTCTVVEE